MLLKFLSKRRPTNRQATITYFITGVIGMLVLQHSPIVLLPFAVPVAFLFGSVWSNILNFVHDLNDLDRDLGVLKAGVQKMLKDLVQKINDDAGREIISLKECSLTGVDETIH